MLATSSRGCKVSRGIAQVSVEDQTLRACPTRSQVLWIRFAKGADTCGSSRNGSTAPEGCRVQPTMHTCTDLATSQPWPHWTTGGYPGFAKATDTCGTLGEVKESCTELWKD